jgi:gluconolactonase
MGVNFKFTEGPAWHPGGFLLFSDLRDNRIVKMTGRKFETFREPSGNANGLLIMKDGSVIACEHGSRSVTRYDINGDLTTLVDQYRGKRLNSPNDLCISLKRIIYFTDPPWGLAGREADPAKELPFNGVFMLRNGAISLIDSTLFRPNGIALSPDEKFLYVANYEESGSGEGRDVFWMRYELNDQGEAIQKSRFCTAPDPSLPGGPDGMKVDGNGNIFATGPGGILVFNPEGEYLGRIELPESATNIAFGQKKNELYVTARTRVLKISLR